MKKQILALLGVGTLAYGSVNLTFTQTQAALTKPIDWTIGYYQNNVSADWLLTTKAIGNGTGAILNPGYTRSGTSPNYDYSSGFGGTGWDHGDFPNIIPNGLTINMVFGKSNTNWLSSGFGLFYPGGGPIGTSLTGVSSPLAIDITFDNQTNKNYLLVFDRSSSPQNNYYGIYYNNFQYGGNNNATLFAAANNLNNVFIPSYTNISLKIFSGYAEYFDAWYLDDLGVNGAYTSGYDDGVEVSYDVGYSDGYNDGFDDGYDFGAQDTYPIAYGEGYDDGLEHGYNNPPITSIFGSAFGAVATIFNIGLFGGLTLGSIIIAPIAVSLLWFILGIVSGVGGKKQ
jgi:hypothetical protein